MSPLVELCGGNLAGKRVLDLGCNAGFWSLQAVESGCDFVLGVDGRQMHIDQAELVFTNKDVPPDRYSFLCGDIFSVDFAGFPQFDVVLCLGLLYHVATPVQLFNLLTRVNSDLLVIDTEVSLARRPSFDLRSESLATARNAIDNELVLVPSRRAVTMLARQAGYDVRVVRPAIGDYTGMADYRIGKRRAFFCAKRTDLSVLPAERETPPMLAKPMWAAEILRRRMRPGRRSTAV